MHITILASVGAQNLGDELIIKNEVQLLEQEFPHSNFRICTYDIKHPFFQQKNVKYIEYFPIDSKKIKNIPRNIKNLFSFLKTLIWSDIVVIGGGGIIYDTEVQSVKNPLNQWIFRTQLARLFQKKIYFYALGIDIKDEKNREKLKKIFKNVWKITVRDIKSWEQLKKIGVESTLVDDPVMFENKDTRDSTIPYGRLLKTLSSRNFSLKDFEDIDFRGKEVGLALRTGYIGKSQNEKVEKLLVEELCQFIENKGGNIIFLPHSLHKADKKANDFLFLNTFVNKRRSICTSLEEVYEWYRTPFSQEGKEKYIISMRLHSIILAYVYSIPQIALSYSQKTEETIKKLNS